MLSFYVSSSTSLLPETDIWRTDRPRRGGGRLKSSEVDPQNSAIDG